MTITLRAYADSDLPLTLALETDPVAMAELGGPRPRAALERVHQIRVQGSHSFVIEEDSNAVGSIFVWAGEHEGVAIHEIGWMVLPATHGRGVATQALALVLGRLRQHGEITELHAFPAATNLASNRLCDRAGFLDQGPSEIEFGDALLHARHRVLELG